MEHCPVWLFHAYSFLVEYQLEKDRSESTHVCEVRCQLHTRHLRHKRKLLTQTILLKLLR